MYKEFGFILQLKLILAERQKLERLNINEVFMTPL